MLEKYLSNLVNEIGVGWCVFLTILMAVLVGILFGLLLLKILEKREKKKQKELQEFIASKNNNNDSQPLAPTSISCRAPSPWHWEMLLKTVNSEEEAFLEIKKFLELNDIRSATTEVEEYEVHDESLGKKTKIKIVKTPVGRWEGWTHRPRIYNGKDPCFVIRYGSAPSRENHLEGVLKNSEWAIHVKKYLDYSSGEEGI